MLDVFKNINTPQYNSSPEELLRSLYISLKKIKKNTTIPDENENFIYSCISCINTFSSSIFNEIKNPVSQQDYYRKIEAFEYYERKTEALNWTVFINYLSDSENKNSNLNLYNKGFTILCDFINLKTKDSNKNISETPTTVVNSFSSFSDRIIFHHFFKTLSKKLFSKKNFNPLNLYSQIIIDSYRDLINLHDQSTPFNVKKYMNFISSIFDITYIINFQQSELIKLLITCNKTQDTMKLKIIHKNNECCTDGLESITIDQNYSMNSFLHEFTHIYYCWKSPISLRTLLQNPLVELYPVYMEKLYDSKQNNDIRVRNTWNSLITYTLVYSLTPFLNNDEEFKKEYLNLFSGDNQYLLKQLEIQNSEFYKKIKNSIIEEIKDINEQYAISYFLSDILSKYLLENEFKNHEEIRKNSYSLTEMLDYLQLTPEDLAEYAYNYFYNNLRTL